MAVALGLAVLDADPKGVHFALVPESIVKRRTLLNKTVWAAGAGVVLMAGLALPSRWSGEALKQVAEKKEHFADLLKKTKREQLQFKKRRADNLLLQEKVARYARQTRMGLVFLNLFVQVREHSPRGLVLVYMGPDQITGLRGGRSLNHDVFETPLRDIVLRGYYNTTEVKDIHGVTDRFFERLEEVPGVENAERALDIDEKDFNPGPGQKPFQFNIRLGDPQEVLTRPKVPPGTDGQRKGGKTAQAAAGKAKGKTR
jgi:hypothetical protein